MVIIYFFLAAPAHLVHPLAVVYCLTTAPCRRLQTPLFTTLLLHQILLHPIPNATLTFAPCLDKLFYEGYRAGVEMRLILLSCLFI